MHVTGGAASQVRVTLLPGDDVFGLGAGDRGTPTRNGQKLRLMNRDTLFYGIAGATYASFPLCWVRSDAGVVFAVLLLTSAALDVVVGEDAIVFSGVAGNGVTHGCDDAVVFRLALAERRALVTADLGFSNILGFPLGSHAGIVVARFPNEVSTDVLNGEIVDAVTGLSEDDLRGNLFIVEPGRVRARRST